MSTIFSAHQLQLHGARAVQAGAARNIYRSTSAKMFAATTSAFSEGERSALHELPPRQDGSSTRLEACGGGKGGGRRGSSIRLKQQQEKKLARRDHHKIRLGSSRLAADGDGASTAFLAERTARPAGPKFKRLLRRVETYSGDRDLALQRDILSNRLPGHAISTTAGPRSADAAAAVGSPVASCRQARCVTVCLRFRGRVVVKRNLQIGRNIGRRGVAAHAVKRLAVHSEIRNPTSSIARTSFRRIKKQLAKKVDLFS